MTARKASTPWWAPIELAIGKRARWRVGPTTLWVHRFDGGWHAARLQSPDPVASDVEVRAPIRQVPPAEAETARFVGGARTDTLSLVPLLADRPVVAHPREPFYILATEAVHLYIGTPVWARLLADETRHTLQEFPLFRPSDTWFGPSTLQGELCYATHTHAGQDPRSVPYRPHRAITQLEIRNRGHEPILIERISLPVPHLALFGGANNRLWTQTAVLEIPADGGDVALHLEHAPPALAGEVQRLAEPRQTMNGNLLKRALGALLG